MVYMAKGEERGGASTIFFGSFSLSLEISPPSFPRRRFSLPPWFLELPAIIPLSVGRRRNGIVSLRGSQTKGRFSLSLRGPRGNEARPLSLGGCRRGGKSLIISLSVGLLVGKGRRSLSGWINWNRKVRFFLAVDLVDGYIWLSVGGSPPRRWSSLSMPLRDSYSESILIMFLSFDSVGFSCNIVSISFYEGINVRRRNQLAFDMFCGKRDQEGSSIQVSVTLQHLAAMK
ncbi:hypothetical protein F2Q69_00008410 [Brassica cretica]|uniref:Uncharacterized protein n=1 Tax=Brassica cretica TaxID=69181 RepID=A0A8S9NXX0_BRACR|nr:hypothetical protein F2Q69_00008410 [Brassica cretica]